MVIHLSAAQPPELPPWPAELAEMSTKSPSPQALPLVFDAAEMSRLAEIPPQFVWPEDEKPRPDAREELALPLIDHGSFISGQPEALEEIASLIDEACSTHGFFQVVNHGIDLSLLTEAHRCTNAFFSGRPLREKQRALRKPGESCGYASSFTARFSSKLPWKETFSFRFSPSSPSVVLDYFVAVLGEDFGYFG
ncbi:hypothetical protein HPP92_014956 [Vanilla planifolia]|uniref:Non-haem dioxygenase N-terminal domain-containing protein n=1 Tax=Vanilla planifolia TaxID=51239 RepID=A0A835QNL6_VANPL|nr:hypothetical protein HPP92_014956 [Vanilla planifolia]